MSAALAALALGYTAIHVARMCKQERLTALLCATPTGEAWYIDPACKPALWLAAGHAETGLHLTGDPVAQIPARKKSGCVARFRVLEQYDASLDEQPDEYSADQWLAMWCKNWNGTHEGRRLSRKTMWRWLAERARAGIRGLVDRRHGFEEVECDLLLWKMFTGLYCSANHLSVRLCHELVAAEAGFRPWPSLRTIQRWAVERLAPLKRAAGRQPKRFEDRFLPYVERDWTQVFAMECWIADNRKLDVFVRVHRRGPGGRAEWRKIRPYIQVWIDARSWFPVAWEMYDSEPDAEATGELFAAGVSLHGAPEQILVDNGAGFRAEIFTGGRLNKVKPADEITINPLVSEMGTKLVRFAIPWNHKAKPIEPWFRFVSSEFDKLFASYTGYSTAVRPGEVDAIPVEKLPTLEKLRDLFGAWLAGTFCRQPSPAVAALGLSPMRAFTDLREPGREYARPSDDTLVLLCRESRRVRVTQNGVWIAEFGRHYWHPLLIERQGSGRDAKRKVCYRLLPGRPERVFISDEQGRFLCAAEPYEGAGMDPLIDAAEDPESARRLASVMELRGAIARHYRREVAEDQAFARHTMLNAQRESLRALGCLDETAAPPPGPANIRFAPHLEAGAAAMAETERGTRNTEHGKTPGERMREFLAGQPVAEPEPAAPTQADLIDDLIKRQDQ